MLQNTNSKLPWGIASLRNKAHSFDFQNDDEESIALALSCLLKFRDYLEKEGENLLHERNLTIFYRFFEKEKIPKGQLSRVFSGYTHCGTTLSFNHNAFKQELNLAIDELNKLDNRGQTMDRDQVVAEAVDDVLGK